MRTKKQIDPDFGEELSRIYNEMKNGVLSSNNSVLFAEEVERQINFCITNSKMKPEYDNVKTLNDIIGIAPKTLIPELSIKAEKDGRLRYLEPLHVSGSENNVMAIYFKHGTYVRPHTHLIKETYYHIISGSLAYMLFPDNNSKPSLSFIVKPGDSFIMKRGITHSVVILDDFCFAISAKLGAYIPETEKTFLSPGFPPDDERDADGKRIIHQKEIDPILAQWFAVANSPKKVKDEHGKE